MSRRFYWLDQYILSFYITIDYHGHLYHVVKTLINIENYLFETIYGFSYTIVVPLDMFIYAASNVR